MGDLFDVAFIGLDTVHPNTNSVKEALQNIYNTASGSKSVDFLDTLPRYKYHVNVDGVGPSWRGLPILASGSVMLLQESTLGEFFIDDLLPWVHYVPFKSDLSDLKTHVMFLRQHDKRASSIAR